MTSAGLNEPVLAVTGLTKSYHRRKVVHNLTFTVQSGEVFGFLGPNGAGKSTTIRMLLALVKADAGEIRIFGRSVTKERNQALQGVGALIEEPSFYKNLSARRNLELLARMETLPAERVEEVLVTVGLLDRADDKVKAYSHGMKQRLGIAQALLSHPKLLILDEPTSGLDPRHMKEVRELIRQLAQKEMTIFLSSHLLHEVEQTCTSMAIINQGRLMVSGRVEALLHSVARATMEIRATPLDRAREIISNLEFVEEVESHQERLHVAVAEDRVSQITRALVEQGVEVNAIIPNTSLEAYFLSLTEEET